jgi:lipoprotein-releasing system permease protein
MIGIALGVAVLITVLSVMNGFDEQIRNRVFSMAQQVTVRTFSGNLNNWADLNNQLSHYPGVTGVVPFIAGQGLLTSGGQNSPVMVQGILPEKESAVSDLANKVVEGSLSNLQPNQFGIVLGQKLADSLGLEMGDKVAMLIPQATVTPLGVFPQMRRFTVVGIFKVGNGFGFDSELAYIHLNDAQKLFMMKSGVTGLQLKLQNLYSASRINQQLSQQLPAGYQVSDWTQDYGAFFQAIKLEKTMIFFILILIIAIAAFNLVSTLVMVVNDKRADIAILRTLGATPNTILATFMVQGLIAGVVGTLLGLTGGVFLSLHTTEIVNAIQQIFHVQLLSSDVYFVDYLPSKIQSSDVIKICSISLILSLLATIYPAWTAARTQPAEALRYE